MADKMNRKYYKLKTSAAVICSAVLLLSFLAFPSCLFAMNVDYMNTDRWNNNSNVQSLTLDYTNDSRTLNGTMYYFTDDELCIYTYFKITESTLSEEANNVYITYTFYVPNEEYEVTVDQNGIYEESGEQEKLLFKVCSSFDGVGKYISAVQYKDKKCQSCSVDISININGRLYSITKNAEFNGTAVNMERPTEAKAEKATGSPTKKQRKQKRKTKPSNKSTTSAKAETTTKFHPGYSITTTAANKQRKSETTTLKIPENSEPDSIHESSESTETIGAAVNETGTQMSGWTMWFLIIAAVIAAAGMGILVTAVTLKKEDTPEETDENKE